ncbi:MAG: carbon-nitrogen hydrolase family protein, partial [Clostridia bacterium]|nr:carbon-nitrogen hydrolase family protein [Clostridia bacterium]
IDLTLSNDKNSDSKFNAISDRNPSLYSVLTENIATLPITEVLSEKVVPSKLSIFVSVVQMKEDITFQQYLDKVSKIVPMMALQNSQLVVFPELKCTYQEDIQERLASKMIAFAHQYSLALVFSLLLSEGDKKYKTAVFVEPTGKVFSYKKTHLSSDEIETYKCGEELPVFETSLGRVGMMMGYEGFIPEVSRVLMLKGADLICWQANSSSNYHSFVVRTRSAENKVFLAVSDTWGKNSRGHSLICNPGGAIVARALHESNQIISSQLELVSTRCKMVVPGTHIVNNRIPKVYNELI